MFLMPMLGIGGWDKRAVMWAIQNSKKGADENKELDKIMNERYNKVSFILDIGGNAPPYFPSVDDGTLTR